MGAHTEGYWSSVSNSGDVFAPPLCDSTPTCRHYRCDNDRAPPLVEGEPYHSGS